MAAALQPFFAKQDEKLRDSVRRVSALAHYDQFDLFQETAAVFVRLLSTHITMDQTPQWDQLVPIPYVPDINEQINLSQSLLDSTDPRYEMHQANIEAAIVLYENGFF